MLPAQLEKANAGGLPQLTQKPKCDAGRSFVGVQHHLLARLGVRRGDITSALAPRELEVEPWLIVCRDNIDGTMAQDKPL